MGQHEFRDAFGCWHWRDRLTRHGEAPLQPRRMFLFSGHMIEAPGRATPRFPADKEAIAADALGARCVRVQPDALGPPPGDANPYERNNLWQRYTALALGADKIDFVGVWNGEGGAGLGGTRHMVDEVRKHAGRVFILDTRMLLGTL